MSVSDHRFSSSRGGGVGGGGGGNGGLGILGNLMSTGLLTSAFQQIEQQVHDAAYAEAIDRFEKQHQTAMKAFEEKANQIVKQTIQKTKQNHIQSDSLLKRLLPVERELKECLQSIKRDKQQHIAKERAFQQEMQRSIMQCKRSIDSAQQTIEDKETKHTRVLDRINNDIETLIALRNALDQEIAETGVGIGREGIDRGGEEKNDLSIEEGLGIGLGEEGGMEDAEESMNIDLNININDLSNADPDNEWLGGDEEIEEKQSTPAASKRGKKTGRGRGGRGGRGGGHRYR